MYQNFWVTALVGAFMGLLDWWLRSADHLPAEAVDEIFHRVAGGMPGPPTP